MKTKLRNRRKGHEKLLTTATQNIIRLEGSINYTTFFLQKGKPLTMSYTLGMYGILLPQTFIRISKCCIINKNFIENLNAENKKILLKDGSEVQISRRRFAEVLLFII
jgi:two-component system, LytTR family, response regulator